MPFGNPSHCLVVCHQDSSVKCVQCGKNRPMITGHSEGYGTEVGTASACICMYKCTRVCVYTCDSCSRRSVSSLIFRETAMQTQTSRTRTAGVWLTNAISRPIRTYFTRWLIAYKFVRPHSYDFVRFVYTPVTGRFRGGIRCGSFVQIHTNCATCKIRMI